MQPPVLETDRLRLDSISNADEDAVLSYCQDEELQRWVPLPVPYDRPSAAFFVGKYARDAADSTTLTLWAIRSDDLLLGVIELRFEPLASATVGFWLGREHRGQGIMTEALQAIVEYAFEDDGFSLRRIHWESLVGNYGSAIVARRAGFQFEGVARQSLVHRDTRVDSWQAALLRDDPREPSEGWPL